MRSCLRASVLLFVVMLMTSGCSSFGQRLKAFLGGKPASDQSSQQRKTSNSTPSYAQNPNMVSGARRRYKRMTKERLEGDSRLGSGAGSLWVMEGQGAFLFSQNVMRMIGDPIAVRIDGEPKEQLSSKVKVVKGLLAKLESRRKALARAQNPQKAKQQSAKAEAPPRAPASKQQVLTGQQPEDFGVKSVPTRIVERMVDGNYRIKGSQTFMIGPREYKVIVTGVVRAEDFADEGISSTKLIDPNFDIVSTRRKARL